MTVFFMMVGLPGSGKSYQARLLAEEYGAVILSSDDYRGKIGESVNDQTVNNSVFETISRDMLHCLKNGTSVIFDATNLNAKRRRSVLRQIGNLQVRKVCVLVLRTLSNCLEALPGRDHDVPEFVLRRMYMSFQTPYYCEGWDEIRCVYTDGDETCFGDPSIPADIYMDYKQDNPHHNETLGEHLMMAADFLKKEDAGTDLITAGLMHDIGKPYCKTFTNSRGEHCDIAHYYGHECVGAYNSLFYDLAGCDKLHVSWLIANHMRVLGWNGNMECKAAQKAREQWGNELFNEIVLLSKADAQAKH